MELGQLRYFLKTRELRSSTDAARGLYISQGRKEILRSIDDNEPGATSRNTSSLMIFHKNFKCSQ